MEDGGVKEESRGRMGVSGGDGDGYLIETIFVKSVVGLEGE